MKNVLIYSVSTLSLLLAASFPLQAGKKWKSQDEFLTFRENLRQSHAAFYLKSKNLDLEIDDKKIEREFANDLKKRQSLDENERETEIPKKIHYVWLGGPIYDDYWSNIIRTTHIAAREGYDVNIWVDNVDNLKFLMERIKAPRKGEELYEKKRSRSPNETYELYVDQLKTIKVRNLSEARSIVPEFLPPAAHKQYWRFIDSETLGLKNYAAASDLLRYLILSLEGGIYCDTDCLPLLFPRQAQEFFGNIKLPFGFKKIEGNNSILLSSPQNPILIRCVRDSLKNYLDSENAPEKNLAHPLATIIDRKRLHVSSKEALSIEKSDRYTFTIQLSGPAVIEKALNEFKSLFNFKQNPCFKLLDFSYAHLPNSYEKSLEIYVDTHGTNLKKAFLTFQQKKITNNSDDTPLSLGNSCVPLFTSLEEFYRYEEIQKNIRDLQSFSQFYFNVDTKKGKFKRDLNKKDINEMNTSFENIIKVDRNVIPLKIGKNFFVEYKCDGTWHGQKNPSSLSTDEFKPTKLNYFLDLDKMSSSRTLSAL